LIKSLAIYLLLMFIALMFGINNAESADASPSYEPPAWKGNLKIGANLQTGNTDRINITVGADAMRKSYKERYSLNFLFNYSEEDSRNTSESYYGAGKYDYFFTKRIYGYIGLELLKDKFKDLSLRTIIGPGAGYQLWDEEKKSLTLEGGVSYFSENNIVAEDSDWITGRLAGNLTYALMTSLTLTDQLIMYPSLEDVGEFQLRNEAAVMTPLSSGWAISLVSILEYDSDPPADIKNTDWNWLLTLQYGF